MGVLCGKRQNPKTWDGGMAGKAFFNVQMLGAAAVPVDRGSRVSAV